MKRAVKVLSLLAILLAVLGLCVILMIGAAIYLGMPGAVAMAIFLNGGALVVVTTNWSRRRS